jgi:hypothetical protein
VFPFLVSRGQTLVLDIDESEWGVLVECEDEITVDVWIDPNKANLPLKK